MMNDYYQQGNSKPKFNYNQRGWDNRQGGSGRSGQNKPQPPQEIIAEPIPEEYVDAAEQVMKSYRENSTKKDQITTSKIRSLLSLISEIYDVERLRKEESLLPESVTKLRMMRVRILYDSGRDSVKVGEFVKKAKLLEYLKGIGSDRKACIQFAHYMEALVAYHRYYDIGIKE